MTDNELCEIREKIRNYMLEMEKRYSLMNEEITNTRDLKSLIARLETQELHSISLKSKGATYSDCLAVTSYPGLTEAILDVLKARASSMEASVLKYSDTIDNFDINDF